MSVRAFVLSPAGLANAALAVSLGFNVWLGVELRAPREAPPATLTSRSESFLNEGDSVPALKGKTATGEEVVVEFKNSIRPTLLYAITPTCEWCSRNEDNFAAVARAVANRWRVVVVSLAPNGTPELLKRMREAAGDTPMTMIAEPATGTKADFKLRASPQTLLVSTDGVILQSWRGAYEGQLAQVVEAAIGGPLPGLRAAPELQAPYCYDKAKKRFSPGYVGTVDGRRVECVSGGKWVTATR